MSAPNLDSELKKVLEAGARGARPPTTPQAAKTNRGLLVALGVIAVAILALVLSTFRAAAVWSTTVDGLGSSQAAGEHKRIRVQGTLVKGTLKKRDEPCEYRFDLQGSQRPLHVRYPQCIIPDSFQDRPEADVEVTAEGTLGTDGVLVAEQILAKCPSKYEARDGKMVPAGPYQ